MKSSKVAILEKNCFNLNLNSIVCSIWISNKYYSIILKKIWNLQIIKKTERKTVRSLQLKMCLCVAGREKRERDSNSQSNGRLSFRCSKCCFVVSNLSFFSFSSFQSSKWCNATHTSARGTTTQGGMSIQYKVAAKKKKKK